MGKALVVWRRLEEALPRLKECELEKVTEL